MDLTGQHVVVTGGAGFIGSGVVEMLVRAGADVTVADLRQVDRDDVRAVTGDLRDAAVREEAVTPGTTAIVHLAALTSVLRSKEAPDEVYATNVAMTQGLLEVAREREVPRLLFTSTNAVTGDVGRQTIQEDLALAPLTPYGATKAAAEMLLSAYAGSFGMRTCALRLTNVYGPGMHHKDSFVPRLMRAARDGGGVEVYGDGEQVRDLVHLDDVCAGLRTVWEADATGPVIIGSGRSVSVNDLVAAAREVTGAEIPARHVPPKPGEMPAVIVSIDRASSLGYAPQVSLDEGMASVWKDFANDRSRQVP